MSTARATDRAAWTMSEAFARRYKLLDRIAIGGTAEVYRALFLTGDGEERPVVIKRVLPQFARDERFRRLFHEEACVAVTMSHPSIVRVLDYGEIGQTCYIALEFVEGKDLGSLSSRARAGGRAPDPVLAAYIAAQVASALSYMHEQRSSEGTPLQIIHRDVSPQNILVSYAGDVKLTDFGIAKSAIRQERTVDGALRGKLDYMAPEQAALGAVDGRTDIFALGCVLYELLEGVPPFRGVSELDTLERVRAGRVRLAPEALDAPAPLRAVLARCLAPRPEERPQRAAELEAELRAYLASEEPPVNAEELGRWARECAALPEAGRASSADEAVRRLLGEAGEEAPAPGSGTTVFASSSPRRGSPAPTAAPATGRRLNLVLALVAALGLCGWLLWGLGVLSRGGAEPGAVRPSDARLGRIVLRDRTDLGARRADLGATMLLSATPSAAVLLGGEPVGWTPIRIRRPTAPVVLELVKEGFQPYRRRLVPAQLGDELRVVLQPLGALPTPAGEPAQLTLNSMPWSRVRIDGKPAGNTPLRKTLRAGPHRIELTAPDGSVRKTLQVTLRPGKRESFSFDFTQP
jgi:serine/threonine-protein kinase